ERGKLARGLDLRPAAGAAGGLQGRAGRRHADRMSVLDPTVNAVDATARTHGRQWGDRGSDDVFGVRARRLGHGRGDGLLRGPPEAPGRPASGRTGGARCDAGMAGAWPRGPVERAAASVAGATARA